VLVAAAVCPHPPLLVPELAGGAAGELHALRVACADVVADLLSAGPDVVAVVGAAPRRGQYRDTDAGSLAPFGVDVRVGPPAAGPVLPLSLTVGAWLLARAGCTSPWRGTALPGDLDAGELHRVAGRLAGLAPRVALLAMADLSATRSERAPGYLDRRAEGYDAAATLALARADRAGLAALDRGLAAELQVGGAVVLALLAHVEGPWVGEVRYAAAPYGVGYVVASWRAL